METEGRVYPSDAMWRSWVQGKLEPPANMHQAFNVMDRLADLLNEALGYLDALSEEELTEDEHRAFRQAIENGQRQDAELGQSIRTTMFGRDV